MSALLLALHTGLRTKATHTFLFVCFFVIVFLLERFIYIERETDRQTDRELLVALGS